MILCIENPKAFTEKKKKETNQTKKWIELINEFSKVVGYEINIQKSVAFLFVNNELSKRENKKKLLLNIASKKNT